MVKIKWKRWWNFPKNCRWPSPTPAPTIRHVRVTSETHLMTDAEVTAWVTQSQYSVWYVRYNRRRQRPWGGRHRLGNITSKKRWDLSSFWSSTVMMSLSRWRRANAKKCVRDRENARSATDEKEAAISHYGLSYVVILFHFKSSFYSKRRFSSHSSLSWSFK